MADVRGTALVGQSLLCRSDLDWSPVENGLRAVAETIEDEKPRPFAECHPPPPRLALYSIVIFTEIVLNRPSGTETAVR